MGNMLNMYMKAADWKREKHSPLITSPKAVKASEAFDVEVALGRRFQMEVSAK